MDDQNFDQKSAREWITLIESPDASVREKDIYPHLKKWIWDNDITNVIDVGCGQGVCSGKIPENTLYLGVEPNLTLLERAKAHYPGRKFAEGSAYNIPVDDASVDGVFSIAVWQLLSDADTAAKEMARVIRPGGYFLIITADPHHEVWTKTHDKLHLRTERDLAPLFEHYGLRISAMGAYRYFWFFEGRKV